MEEQKKNPELRFEGFSEDWIDKKFEKVFKGIRNNSLSRDKLHYKNGKAKNIHYGDILVKFGEIVDIKKQQLPFVTDDEIAESLKSSQLINGDIILADAAEDETVGKCVEIQNINKEVVLSGLHTIAVRPQQPFAPKYLGYYMNSNAYHDQLIRLMQGTKVLSISKTAIQDTDIRYPSNEEEQSKICKYLTEIDELITKHQKKHNRLITLKKSMLEKMFPKEEQTIPEIRFKGFEGDWEELKLNDVSEPLEYGLNAAAKLYDGKNKYLRITDIDESSREFSSNDITSPDIDFENANNYVLKENDILFARTGASVGKTYHYKKKDGVVYFAGFLIRARIKKGYSSELIYQYSLTSSYDKYIQITSQRSGQPGVNAQEYSAFAIRLPITEAEQFKITEYFQSLDTLISSHKKQLQKLNNFKQSLSEKMFV